MLDAEQRQRLGAFIRARREGLTSDNAGGRRRTPGLRREELAARAGIGATWITWIEQGRDIRASAATLGRLADALHLTRAERTYLFALAERHDPAHATGPEAAPEAMAALAAALPCPAYVLDPRWDVVAANAAARRLFPGLFDAPFPNLLRYVFTHPAAPRLLPDHAGRCARVMAEFRRDYARALHDPRVRALVEALRGESALFAQLWDMQAVIGREGGERRFDHPELGQVTFVQHVVADVERGDFRLVALIEALAKPDAPRHTLET